MTMVPSNIIDIGAHKFESTMSRASRDGCECVMNEWPSVRDKGNENVGSGETPWRSAIVDELTLSDAGSGAVRRFYSSSRRRCPYLRICGK